MLSGLKERHPWVQFKGGRKGFEIEGASASGGHGYLTLQHSLRSRGGLATMVGTMIAMGGWQWDKAQDGAGVGWQT